LVYIVVAAVVVVITELGNSLLSETWTFFYRNLPAFNAVHTTVTVRRCIFIDRGILTGDWLRAADAFLGEILREAVGAEWFLVARSELFADQHLVASGARETLSVPRRSFVRDASLVDHLYTNAAVYTLLAAYLSGYSDGFKGGGRWGCPLLA